MPDKKWDDAVDPREVFDVETKEAYQAEMDNGDLPEWETDPRKKIYDDEVVRYRFPKKYAEKLRKYGCVPDPSGCNTCIYPPEYGRILYMDVGRWGGGAPTAEDTYGHWGRRRNFGIVCGRLAALCDYPVADSTPGLSIEYDNNDQDLIESSDEYWRITRLLEALSSTYGTRLGKLKVRILHGDKTTDSSSTAPQTATEVPSKNVIHVFLGDIHAPVLDGLYPWRTLFADNASTCVDAARKGRIDPNLGGQLDMLEMLLSSRSILSVPMAPVLLLQLIPALTDEKLQRWSDEDRLSKEKAFEWLKRYCGDSISSEHWTATGHQRGADIFDGADIELCQWLDILIEYNRYAGGLPIDSASSSGIIMPKVRLVQLGDCLDFWIGMQRLNDWDSNGKCNVRSSNKTIRDQFVNFWIEETKRTSANISGGGGVKKLLELNQTGDLPFVMINGNHDNYLYDRELDRYSSDYQPLADGIYAEHGHQIDEFNKDSGYGKGWALTQLAYLKPSVRYIETPLKAFSNKYVDQLAARLEMYHRAVTMCVGRRLDEERGPLFTYVQGHTHSANLRMVSLDCMYDPESDPESEL